MCRSITLLLFFKIWNSVDTNYFKLEILGVNFWYPGISIGYHHYDSRINFGKHGSYLTFNFQETNHFLLIQGTCINKKWLAFSQYLKASNVADCYKNSAATVFCF